MDFPKAMLEALDTAMTADGAQLGNVQLFSRSAGGLQIQAQRGFSDSFLSTFRIVRPDEATACARAFRLERRVCIPDVFADPLFLPYRSIADQAGFRAVQSTPIRVRGRIAAVLSTHFA